MDGDVAVLDASSGAVLADGAELSIGAGVMLSASAAADTIRIGPGAVVSGDASYNQLTNYGQITGDAISPLDLPLAISLPLAPPFTPGTELVELHAHAQRTLTEGAYGRVALGAKSTLTLSGGVYDLRLLELGAKGRIICSAACELRIAETLTMAASSRVEPIASPHLGPSDVQIFVNGTAPLHQGVARIGASATLRARVFAPRGTVSIGANADASGTLVGRDIDVQPGARVDAFKVVEIDDLVVPEFEPGDEITLRATVNVGALPEDPATCAGGCRHFLAYKLDIRQPGNFFPFRRLPQADPTALPIAPGTVIPPEGAVAPVAPAPLGDTFPFVGVRHNLLPTESFPPISAPRLVRKWGHAGTGPGQFNQPLAVAADRDGNVYVSDADSRVQKFTEAGTFVLEWGSIGEGDGQFLGGFGLAVTSGSDGAIYVADAGNHRIQKFAPDGTFLMKWGSSGSSPGQFRTPINIAFSTRSGLIYVVDFGNHRVQRFTTDGTFVGEFGSSGTGDGQFESARGIAIDPSTEDVYVTDFALHRVQRFTREGAFVRAWGQTGSGDADLVEPVAVSVDVGGRVYVADAVNDRITVFSRNGDFLGRFGQTGSGDGEMERPQSVFVDITGSIYVADSEHHRIEVFRHPESIMGNVGLVELTAPGPVTIEEEWDTRDHLGNFIVNDNFTATLAVRQMTLSGGIPCDLADCPQFNPRRPCPDPTNPMCEGPFPFNPIETGVFTVPLFPPGIKTRTTYVCNPLGRAPSINPFNPNAVVSGFLGWNHPARDAALFGGNPDNPAIWGTDLGTPVVHGNRTVFFFGDSYGDNILAYPFVALPPPFIIPGNDDTMAVTGPLQPADAPSNDFSCLDLEFFRGPPSPDDAADFDPIRVGSGLFQDGGHYMGGLRVPGGGFSIGSKLLGHFPRFAGQRDTVSCVPGRVECAIPGDRCIELQKLPGVTKVLPGFPPVGECFVGSNCGAGANSDTCQPDLPRFAELGLNAECTVITPCTTGECLAPEGACFFGAGCADLEAGNEDVPCFVRQPPGTLMVMDSNCDNSSGSITNCFRPLTVGADVASQSDLDRINEAYAQHGSNVFTVSFSTPDLTASTPQVFVWGREAFLTHRNSNGGEADVFLWRHSIDVQNGRVGPPTYYCGTCVGGPFSPNKSDADAVMEESRFITNQTSVFFAPSINRWVLIYGGRLPFPFVGGEDFASPVYPTVTKEHVFDTTAGIYVRLAPEPWGPWSSPTTIYNPYVVDFDAPFPDKLGYCFTQYFKDTFSFMNANVPFDFGEFDNLCNAVPRPAQEWGKFVTMAFPDKASKDAKLLDFGAEYGSAVIQPFVSGTSGKVEFKWLLSNWNPYRPLILSTELDP